MRRLDFVEQHVERIERHGPWQAQMTVADADIMPLASHQAVYHNLLSRLAPWQWIVITIAALLAGIGIGLIV